ncbi:hypothetical protein H4J58_09180 [Colwellia sp. MB3u-70]|uniref:hypothetical protein n=1 Tax=unclassified Colwellia TaxID=196834 RepID=UPI0015F4E79C|nr:MULTISPECIES: hypothetical protein [unclassified Colwellia]MBA6291300.1 hypothetical protein [Colwellia sp. MB3u-8]MBA6307284.1 hypothetical protein [Colwellia sp. MB3u-70]
MPPIRYNKHKHNLEQVNTGVRGVAYIRLSATKGKQPSACKGKQPSAWPVFLQKSPDDINPAEQSRQ